MRIFSFIINVTDWIKEKVEDALDQIKYKLSNKKYDVTDHIDADAKLEEFRMAINGEIEFVEKMYGSDKNE